MRRRCVRLLEINPRLGAGLTGEARAEARRMAVAPTAIVPPGDWDAVELLQRLGPCRAGCMIADGIVAHDLVIAGRTATHLLGRGDILAPAVRPCRHLPVTRIFGLAEPTRVALLDESFAAVARRWPSIAEALVVHAERQMERVAVQQLISQLPRAEQRIVALLWHLSDRWGREESDGVVVPLMIGHEAMSHLVDGRRPTISAALANLADRNLVVRLANGTWWLSSASRAMLDHAATPAPTPSVRLLAASTRIPLADGVTS